MTRITEIIVQLCIALAMVALALAGPEIPTDASKVDSWFSETIGPVASRKGTLNPDLVTAEASPVLIKVRKDGSGDFGSVKQALGSVKVGNKVRTIIDIGPGVYTEKIEVENGKPYITFLGDSKNMPTLVFNDDAAKTKGTDFSATVFVNSDYFVASNIIFKNSSPRPTMQTKDGQALALRIEGRNAALYNCRLIGFQDTLGDDKYNHFYKDCYIEGTVDFVFGAARSIFLNCELHVIPGDNVAMITANFRLNADEEGAFVIVHCKVTGRGKIAVLGRTWSDYPQVIFMYSTISDAISPEGWTTRNNPASEKTAYFAELENVGEGADTSKRVPWVTKVTPEQAKKFLTLDFIDATKWLLPPPEAKGASAASAKSPSVDESPSASKTPSAKSPSSKSPSDETPSAKTTPAKNSSSKSPSNKTPSAKTTPAKTPPAKNSSPKKSES